jgi:HEAT repeat protein
LIPIIAIGMATLMVGMGDDRRDNPSHVGLSSEPFFAGRRLSEWIKLLDSQDLDRRLGAARALGDLGADAKAAVPALIRRLTDRDAFVPTAAANSLGAIGPEAAAAIPAMADAFRRSSGFDRGIIGPAMARIGPRAVPAIVELTKSSDEFARWEATRALRLIGAGAVRGEARLLELLSDPTASTRVEAAHALWKIRPRKAAFDTFIRGLRDPDEFARAEAAAALAELGEEAAPALPDLVHALGDSSASIRGAAAKAIGRIGPRAKSAVPTLLRSVSHSGEGPFFGETGLVTEVVKGIGPGAAPELVAALENPAIRVPAAWGLGQLGVDARSAAPRLRVLMTGAEGKARIAYGGIARTAFARSLWRIDRDPAVVPVLIDLIRVDDFLVQRGAFDVLEEIGPEARPAIPRLIEMLDHKNRFLREAAAKVLGLIGPAAEAAIPGLEKALGDPETSTRIEAATALWRIAHTQVAVVALSAEARKIADSSSTFAATALGEIGPQAESCVPALMEALGQESIFGKAIAAQALGRIGPKAKAAIPRLIEIHNDIHNIERKSFGQALEAIDPEAAHRAGVR